jgi:hypothetical protein
MRHGIILASSERRYHQSSLVHNEMHAFSIHGAYKINRLDIVNKVDLINVSLKSVVARYANVAAQFVVAPR